MDCNDCLEKPVCKNLCNRHYLQIKRHGFTFVTYREPRYAIHIEDQWCLPVGVQAKDGYAMIDEEDKWLERYHWSLSHGYPCSKTAGFLHRKVMDAPNNMEVDHKNGNTMDARKKNLRICTRGQNTMNRGKAPDNKSGFKGVSWRKDSKNWRAVIQFQGKRYSLGNFDKPGDAAKAYDTKAKELFREFARLNYGT